MTKADIYQFMSRQKLGVLGTLTSGGNPQSALVGIAVTPELEIIFDTVKNSRKFRNLMSNSDETAPTTRTCHPRTSASGQSR